jgi:alpha-amylase/alpha-mannosidase (GH57 family)
MKKFVCIHGHFYQPPRENAWLEMIEQQDSAFPYHDWNERIAFECYGPNAYSRILNHGGEIINIVNNYSRISFNFGPTLLQWLQAYAPDIYLSILRADKISALMNHGHGSALAQVYNHMIMPLACARDKETQVVWGIRDFEFRFGRKPEGMWLAETAVDTDTLEVLAEHGIAFTILAPRQAAAVRSIGASEWEDVSGEKVDTTKPYLCKLPSGKSIALFFYNGMLSREVAFGGILSDGKVFADTLIKALPDHRGGLIHIATDGESYGHHHLHGDMALAFCLDYLEKNSDTVLINYGGFLEKFPPEDEVKIFENSSWSCAHGIERWRSDCGCNSGNKPGWHQKWRKPLREALDFLRDELAVFYEQKLAEFTNDPWKARNEYIHVVLKRDEASTDAFIRRNCSFIPEGEKKTTFLRMLEMQRQLLLMYTSCAWFFDDISGIETIQVLQYADRAIQLAESETGKNFLPDFLQLLSKAPTNDLEYKDGAYIHEYFVSKSRLTLSSVGMHYAVASLFEAFPESIDICNYRAESEDYERLESGVFRVAVGKTTVRSNITFSIKQFYFAVLYLGQHHIIGNAQSEMEEEQYNLMKSSITNAFSSSRIEDVIGAMQLYFGPEKFSLWSLFRDEQRKVLNQIVKNDLMQAEDSYRKIFNRNADIMKVLKQAGFPVPKTFYNNLETVLNMEIKDFFKQEKFFVSRLEKLSSEVKTWNITLDKEEIAFYAAQKILFLLESLRTHLFETKYIASINRALAVLDKLEIAPDTWKSQNAFFYIAPKIIESLETADLVSSKKEEYRRQLKQLAGYLKVSI